ncbi:uncharacterized protein Tco025E_03839 [Trypanosoma conorhini]|uniref:Uncharacterized protein n=1 Tax=Trypanosoma conorhini TaxID=83891 RepID=A0A422PRY3_9TRYP|nr:uncharacterized protein Tco025E_03839 [Trypanosoma conorhini]RNF20267.1 hypothetical protein Tco025E_03839 [Trypanosoma conorhini]
MPPSSLPSRRRGAAATRRSTSPVGVMRECLRPPVGAARWQAVPRAACSLRPAAGVARALTAPTPTRKAPPHRTKGLHTFPSEPAQVGLGAAAQTGWARNELSAAARAADDVLPAPRPREAASSVAVASSSAACGSPAGVRPTSAAATVLAAAAAAAAAAGVSEDSAETSRASLSRRGLSVHATPFRPRAATALSRLTSGAEASEVGSLFPPQHAQPPEVGGRQPRPAHTPAPEFPRTPLASELTGVRLSTSSGNIAFVTVPHVSSTASFGGGDSLQMSTSLLSPSPAATTLHRPQQQQQQQQLHLLRNALRVGGSSSDTIFSPSDLREESFSDDVRHRRVPFTDAEAMDEAVMLHLLRGSSGSSSSVADHDHNDDENDDDDDDDDDAVCVEQLQHLPTPDAAATLQTDLDANHYAGGFWDLEGPSAATRRFLHRVASSTASLALTTRSGRGSPAGPRERGAAGRRSGFNADSSDDLWEMNSSAYADSLDDAQVEWIEQQLRAKENPDDFFF